MAMRQYIGARYTTKVYENSLDPSSAEWEAGVTYEPLTLVTYLNSSYLSKMDVPGSVGDPAANPSYWVVTGAYNGQIMQLQNDVATINSKIAYVNEPVNIKSLGAKNDGSEDISSILQDAIDNYNVIYMPEGTYLLNSGVNLKEGTIIYGDGQNVWQHAGGTQINCAAGITAFTGNDVKSVVIHDITINDPGIGILLDGGCFNVTIENVTVYQSTVIGISVPNAWAYNLKHVRIEGGATGIKISEGTCVTLESCIAYGCTTTGFDCESCSGVFIACESDGSVVGFTFGDDNKLVLADCAVEGATAGCFIFDGVSSHVTAIDMAFGPHDTMAAYMITVNQNFQIDFINIRLGSVSIPASPYGVFDIASTAVVTLENCFIANRTGNLPDNVTIVGGSVYGRNIGVTSPAFTSKMSTDTIVAHGTTGTIMTLATNATYIVSSSTTSSGSQGGISLINVSNDPTNAVVTALQGSAVIVCHVASDGALTLESTSSYDLTVNTAITRIR